MRIPFTKGGRETGYLEVVMVDRREATVRVDAIEHEDHAVKCELVAAIRENALRIPILGGTTPESLESFPEGILSVLHLLAEDGEFEFVWPAGLRLPEEREGVRH